MPPTTGGSTSDRASRSPGKVALASTNAMGVPSSTHSTVLAVEVFRLSHSAATEDSDLISSKNDDHWTRASMATSGSTMKTPPTTAGTKIQPGSPDPVPARRRVRRAGNVGVVVIQTVTQTSGREVAG